jgi:hypothetical protein
MKKIKDVRAQPEEEPLVIKGTVFETIDPALYKNEDGTVNQEKINDYCLGLVDAMAKDIEKSPILLKKYTKIIENGSPEEVEKMLTDAFMKGIQI